MTDEAHGTTSTPAFRRAVEEHVEAVGSALNDDLADVVDRMRDLLAQRITELDGDPALVELLRASVEGNVDNILHALQHGIRGERLEPPSAAFEYARRLAQRGVPVNALVRAYRLGHQYLMRRAFAASAALEAPDAVRAAAYDVIVSDCFDYIDWITQRVVTVYEEERDSWLANRANSRQARVRELLLKPVEDVSSAELAIGYRLGGHHVAVVAWVDGEGAREDQLSRFVRTIKQLAGALGTGQAPLVIGQDRATAWGWIPVGEDYRWRPDLARWVPGDVDGPPVPVLALGSAHEGLEGFRRSHAEALRVRTVGQLNPRSATTVLSHDAPGLASTALLAQQPEVLRDWVGTTLGALATDDEQNARRRETLLSFLQHNRSYTATAEAMLLHKNSIKYRIETTERVLGRDLDERPLEVELALTACHWMGAAVLH